MISFDKMQKKKNIVPFNRRTNGLNWFETYLYNGSLSPSRYQSTMNTTSPFSNGSMSQGNIACLPNTPRTDVIGTVIKMNKII